MRGLGEGGPPTELGAHAGPHRCGDWGPFRRAVAICNASSGERSAFDFLFSNLSKQLGSGRVVNLIPRPGRDDPAAHGPAAAAAMLQREGLAGNDLVLVAGGDGTVAWVMNILDEVYTRRPGARVRLRRDSLYAALGLAPDELATVAAVGAGGECFCRFRGADPVRLLPGELEGAPRPAEFRERPFVAVIPLGTGNDLSRALGFGPGFVQSFAPCRPLSDIAAVVESVRSANRSVLDRWKVEVWSRNPSSRGRPRTFLFQLASVDDVCVGPGLLGGPVVTAVATGSAAEAAGLAVGLEVVAVNSVTVGTAEEFRELIRGISGRCAIVADQLLPVDIGNSSLSNNYVSIGFDAVIAERFDLFRKQFPLLCRTRLGNKIWFGALGASASFGSTRVARRLRLFHRATAEESFRESTLRGTGLRSVVLSNLDSFAAGMNPWGDRPPGTLPCGSTTPPRPFDQLIEVCGFHSSPHMGLAKVGCGSSLRICQAGEVVIEVARYHDPTAGLSGLRMQVDGEPVCLPPDGARVRVSFLRTVRVLAASARATAPQDLVENPRVGAAPLAVAAGAAHVLHRERSASTIGAADHQVPLLAD